MKNTEDIIQKPCGYCGGKGKTLGGDFGHETVICPICNGSSNVNIPADSIPHGMCNGSGKIRLTRGPMGKINVTCPDCRGTGWFGLSYFNH